MDSKKSDKKDKEIEKNGSIDKIRGQTLRLSKERLKRERKIDR